MDSRKPPWQNSSCTRKIVLNNRRIGVLLGGLSPETDVSRRSGAAMAAALQRLGYTVTAIEADRSLADALVREPDRDCRARPARTAW